MAHRHRSGWVSLTVGALVLGMSPVGVARAADTHRTNDVLVGDLLSERLGPADPARRMDVEVMLADPKLAEERALANAVVDPHSPQYHRFLTPAEYAERFALPITVRDRALRWLRAGGLDAQEQSGTGDLLHAAGTVAQLEKLFNLRLGRYRVGDTTFVANDRAPAVPADLPVKAVLGLETLHRFAVPKHTVHPMVGNFSGLVDVRSLWKTYDVPAGNEGEGSRAGVFMVGNTAPVVGSLRVFETVEKLPRVPVRTVLTAPGRPEDFEANEGGIEWMLDSQSSTGMAPRMSELALYTAKSLGDADIVAAFAYWANDPHGPTIMNASFGGCEAMPFGTQTGRGDLVVQLGNNIQEASDKSLMQAFTEGRTLFASSGDTGSGCASIAAPIVGAGNGAVVQPVPAQNYPAVSPWVTAVGGTVLDLAKDGTRKDEQAWAFTGGGSSLFIPEPPWQKGEPNINRPCLLTDPDGVPLPPGTICRGVPDVAALSGNLMQGFRIFSYNKPDVASGTSLSSPLTMGMWARVLAAADRPIGPAAPVIYRLSAQQRATDLHPITQGELGGNGLYLPGPGWNYTSGYGALNVAKLTADLAGATKARKHPKPARVPEPRTGNSVACKPFGTSPAGNIGPNTLGDSGKGQDITDASMTTSADGKSVVITVHGPQLTPTVPLGAPDKEVAVSWFRDGVTYVATARVDLVGQVSGSVDKQKRMSDDATTPTVDTDKPRDIPVTWTTGTVTMTVPLDAVGSPHAGDRFREPIATAGSRFGPDDVAGPTYDYTVGQRCR
jgi:subtilase family serine protease